MSADQRPVTGTDGTAPVAHFIQRLGVGVAAAGPDASEGTVTMGDAVDAGRIVTLVDVVAGHLAMVANHPCSLATTEIVVSGLDALPAGRPVTATARALGASAGRAVVHVDLSGPDGPGGAAAPAAVSVASFTLWRDHVPGDLPTWEIVPSGEAMTGPLWDELGMVVPEPGVARVELRPDIGNHVGALQGGATAALLEAAATSLAPAGAAVRSMALTYVAQNRRGPVVARARRLGDGASVDVLAREDGGSGRPTAHALLTFG